MFTLIDQILLSELASKAKNSPRKRMNHNFHSDLSDTLQRMLNSVEPGSYCRPHRHLSEPKREVFLILKGRIAVFHFNHVGEIVSKTILDTAKGVYGIEIPPGEYHSIVSLESGSVVYELKDGPYIPLSDKDFAPWAPAEGSAEADDYLNKLMKLL